MYVIMPACFVGIKDEIYLYNGSRKIAWYKIEISDNKLKFDIHVAELCKRAARQLNFLKRLSTYLDTKCKLLIFRNFILSNFNYRPLVWHFCGSALTNKMEKLQECGLRFVYDDYKSNYH